MHNPFQPTRKKDVYAYKEVKGKAKARENTVIRYMPVM